MKHWNRLACMALILCLLVGVARAGEIQMKETDYALWPQSGPLTGWGGVRRQGQGYAGGEITQEKLTVAWQHPLSPALGMAYSTQPMIVKWFKEMRDASMTLYPEAVETIALKEAIVAGQDGKLYFLNAMDGTPTRDAIDAGAGFTGTPSIAPNGLPLMLVATTNGMLVLDQRTGRMHLSDEEKSGDSPIFLTHRNFHEEQPQQIVYLKTTGELGVMNLQCEFNTSVLEVEIHSIGYQSFPLDQGDGEHLGGLAWDYQSLYCTTEHGELLRFDTATAESRVLAKLAGDSSGATPMLGDDGSVYVSSSGAYNSSKTSCYLERFDPEGNRLWCYQVDGEPTDTPQYPAWNGLFPAWCASTATLGAGNAEGMVFFTVRGGNGGVYALDAETGELLWHFPMDGLSLCGSVLAQASSDKAYLLQTGDADGLDGMLYLLDAKTGKQLDALKLSGDTVNPPAVWGNMAVIATYDSGSDAQIYGIRIE